MKISKILAGMSAMAIAGSVMAMAVSADDATEVKRKPLLSCTVEKSSGPSDNTWTIDPLTIMSEADAAKVDKIEATVTNQAFVNGAMGVNSAKAGGWLAGDKVEISDPGTSIWTMSDIGGLAIDTDKDTGAKTGYVQFQIWWMNAQGDDDTGYTPATTTLDKVVFRDADGNALATVEGDEAQGGNTVDLSEYKKQTEVTLNSEGQSTSDGGKVRINIKHPWCDDAHKAAFNLVDDWSVFAGADAIAVTVDISNVTDAFTAYPCFTNGIENGIGYWEASDNNPAVTVNADGTYTFIVKFPSALEMDANNMFFDIATDLAGTDDEDPAVKMAVKNVVVLNKSDAEPTDPSESTADSTDSDESKVILTDSSDSKTNSAATSSKAANNASNTNPSTGAAALAAVGVALAGAAVVATKKRK